MSDTLSIVEVARQTGISSRTLRYYESRGLLNPLRTASGRRAYDRAQIARLHRIMLLKRAGLTLAQIGQILEGGPADMKGLLREQLRVLEEQRVELEAMHHRLDAALLHLGAGQELDAEHLCRIIRASEECADGRAGWKGVIDDYWSPKAQAEWRETMQALWVEHPEWANGGYEKQWRDLGERIAAKLPMDPLGEEALAFVREWNALIEPMTRIATPSMRASTAAMFEDMDKWQGDADTAFGPEVYFFIRDAQQQLQAAGHDIGLSPFTMRPMLDDDGDS